MDTEANIWPNIDAGSDIWGRLLGNNIQTQHYDLTKETFTAGREKTNDYIFSDNIAAKVVFQISRKHFSITKDLSNMSNPAYIEDFSRNGTYINGERVVRNVKRILAHNDVISVGHPLCKAFVYKDQRPIAHDLSARTTQMTLQE